MAFAILLASGPGAGAASITDPARDPLEGPFADAVFVGAGEGGPGGDARPRLIVLRSPAVDPNGVSHVAVLERSGTRPGWAVVAEHAVPSGLAGSADEESADGGFLVPLADDTFVLVVPGRYGQTAAALLELTADHHVIVRTRTTIPIEVEGVGVADTDADGRPEVVVLDRATGLCGDADARVIDSTDLHEVRQIRVPFFRTGPAVLGRFDERPGVDLAIGARRTCAGDEATAVDALLLSLATGSWTELPADVPVPGPGTPQGPARPLAADIDRDGRDDLVTEGNGGLAVRLAVEGWKARSLDWDGLPIAAIGDRDGGAWVAALDTASGSSAPIRLRHIALAADGSLVFGADTSATASRSAAAFTAEALGRSAPLRLATGSWAGDVDLDGCQDLLVPRLTVRCSSGGEIRPGPGWYATTPFAAFGEAGARRLLVAGTAEWPRRMPRLAAPSPAGDASAEPHWRDSASAPFLISDVAVGDLLYHVRFPVPAVSMGREQTSRDELGVTIGGYVGERLFVRARPMFGNEQPAAFESQIDFLVGGGGPRTDKSVHRIGIAPGGESGARDGFIKLPLPTDAAAHQVTVVGLNDWGEVSAIEETRIEADRIGPTLVVQAPLTSLPWPLVARIDGVADPGAQVRVGEGVPVEAARNGKFSIRTSLAPWPQMLDIRATDPAGNETVRRLSVVGGIDYRQLPWDIIIGAAVLIATVLAALRSPRRLAGLAASPHRVTSARGVPTIRGAAIPAPAGMGGPGRDDPWAGHAYDADGEPIAVIEDLD